MLIYDASYRETNKGGEGLQDYLNGKVTMDAAPGGFKEEDHPRGSEGSGKGGQFVKSNKTIEKEDDLGSPADSSKTHSSGSQKISASVAAMALADKAGRGTDSNLISKIESQIKKLCNPQDDAWKKNAGSLIDPQETRKRQAKDLIKKLSNMQEEAGHHQFSSVINSLQKSL